MDQETEFNPSITLTGREREWVLEALNGFYHDRILTDLLYRVKGGKEATVFCGRANPSTGTRLVAAKVFRPRMFRAMKYDAMYREGRTLLDGEGKSLFDRVMRNVELFLGCHRIHADLSAYNVLYWRGKITIIDFPQTVDAIMNPHAFFLLSRDVERVCQYFNRYGLKTDPARRTADLWSRYRRGEL